MPLSEADDTGRKRTSRGAPRGTGGSGDLVPGWPAQLIPAATQRADGGHTLAQAGVAIAYPLPRGQVIRGRTSERPLSSSQGEDASPTFGQPSTAAVTDVCTSPSFQEFRNSGIRNDFPLTICVNLLGHATQSCHIWLYALGSDWMWKARAANHGVTP